MFSYPLTTAAVCAGAAILAAATLDGVTAEKTPSITFKPMRVSKGLKECPNGKVKIKLSGGEAELFDARSGKRISEPLAHDREAHHRDLPHITCWAFSPDGKLVATGSGRRSRKLGGREGQICVWNVATGERVATHPSSNRENDAIGDVESLSFSKDGKRVLFQARAFELTGK